MIINIFNYLLYFLIVWFLSMLCHERMHAYEHYRQTGQTSKIKIWWYMGCIPSMHVLFDTTRCGFKDRDMVLLSGGLYTSLCLFALAFVYMVFSGTLFSPLGYSLLCVGCVQFFYGYFEMQYLDKLYNIEYMKLHYLLYVVVLCWFSVLWVMR